MDFENLASAHSIQALYLWQPFSATGSSETLLLQTKQEIEL